MGHADAGNDAHIRACRPRQTVDFAGVAHAHLDDRVLGAAFQPHQGAGHSQLIVLVALGLDGLAKAAQGGVGHLLGGGLAHAAGHAHHFGVELAAIIGTQHHHGVVAVRADHALLLRHAFHGVVQHHAECAVFQRLGGKIMAVKFFARERHKDAPGADLTAVGGHQRDRGLALGQRVDRQALQQDVCCNCFHTLIPLYPQIRCTMVPCWTLEPGASLWLWTVPEPSTVQLSPAAFSICRAKSALLPVTSGTSACLPS